MADKLKYILNADAQYTSSSVDYNQWLKILNTQLNEPTNTNTKSYHKTLGTCEINSPMSPLSLECEYCTYDGNNL